MIPAPPAPGQPRSRRRQLAAAALATALTLAAAELGLRLALPDLPSLAAAVDSPYTLQTAVPTVEVALHHPEAEPYYCPSDALVHAGESRERSLHGAAAEGADAADGALALWTAGDSVTWGLGVDAGDSFPRQLADRLAASRGRPVALRNLAQPGLGACAILRDLAAALDEETPDAVLLTLFGDDLEDARVYAIGEGVVMLPGQIRVAPLRWAARRSYAVNLGWFAIARQRDSRLPPALDGARLSQLRADLDALAARAGRDGFALLVMVLAPAGLPWCPQQAAPDTRCGWTPAHLDALVHVADEAAVPWVDLRGVWDDRALLPVEPLALGPDGLALHPRAAGHARIAATVLPAVEEVLDRRETAGP